MGRHGTRSSDRSASVDVAMRRSILDDVDDPVKNRAAPLLKAARPGPNGVDLHVSRRPLLRTRRRIVVRWNGRRVDEVRIELRRGIVSIPWSSRDALLEQLRNRDSMNDVRDVRDAFLAVETTKPRPSDGSAEARTAERDQLLGERDGQQLRRPSGRDLRPTERAPRRPPRRRRSRGSRARPAHWPLAHRSSVTSC